MTTVQKISDQVTESPIDEQEETQETDQLIYEPEDINIATKEPTK